MPPNTTTQIVIDGLPTEEGYVPGSTYDLTLWVLGGAVPVGGLPLFTARAGFNLEVTAGSLAKAAGDDTVQVQVLSECQLRQRASSCNPATNCGVTGPDLCRTEADCITRRCSTPGVGSCRLCSDTLVYVQATHTAEGGTGPSPVNSYSDGNSVLNWSLTWTAPNPGVGDVSFYMAGNAVNGNGAADPFDARSVLDPPVVLRQAP